MLLKILLLIIVIGFAWFGWRRLKRIGAIGRERLGRADAPPPSAPQPPEGGAPPRKASEDMEKCPECGAYVAPRLAGPCGRPGCPYG